MPFAVGLNWLRVAFKCGFFDGTDKLLTFQFCKDREFNGAVIGFLPLCVWSKWLMLWPKMWLSAMLHLPVSVRVGAC